MVTGLPRLAFIRCTEFYGFGVELIDVFFRAIFEDHQSAITRMLKVTIKRVQIATLGKLGAVLYILVLLVGYKSFAPIMLKRAS